MNPHALSGTSPSSWRVCLFRHSDEWAPSFRSVSHGSAATNGPGHAPPPLREAQPAVPWLVVLGTRRVQSARFHRIPACQALACTFPSDT